MPKLIAMAILQALLKAGAPAEELGMECYAETLTLQSKDGKLQRTKIELCQAYVSKDRRCQAHYDHAKGFVVHCDESVRGVDGATIL